MFLAINLHSSGIFQPLPVPSEATVEPSTVVAGSGTEKRKRMEGALGDQPLGAEISHGGRKR